MVHVYLQVLYQEGNAIHFSVSGGHVESAPTLQRESGYNVLWPQIESCYNVSVQGISNGVLRFGNPFNINQWIFQICRETQDVMLSPIQLHLLL